MDARKADARRKIQLGGLVRAAGLDRDDIDAITLLGAFLEVARQLTSNPGLALNCRRAGLAHIERQQIAKNPDLVPVTVRFAKAPPQAARDEIKAQGLSFTDEREWRGLVPSPEPLRAVASKWGGEFFIHDDISREAGK